MVLARTTANAFRAWFIEEGSAWCGAAASQTRTDFYVRDAAQDKLGINKRGGEGIEIKGLIKQSPSRAQLAGCSSPVEVWAKWSSGTLDLGGTGLLEIRKQRWMRKFRTSSGTGTDLIEAGERVERSSGCDAELTLLTLPDEAIWWTFGFEAFGAFDQVEGDLAATVASLAGRRPPDLPEGLAAGYPA